jgi:hypothetical protein
LASRFNRLFWLNYKGLAGEMENAKTGIMFLLVLSPGSSYEKEYQMSVVCWIGKL